MKIKLILESYIDWYYRELEDTDAIIYSGIVSKNLGSKPNRIQLTISDDKFKGSEPVMFLHNYGDAEAKSYIKIDGEWHDIGFMFAPKLVCGMLGFKDGNKKFHFKIKNKNQ